MNDPEEICRWCGEPIHLSPETRERIPCKFAPYYCDGRKPMKVIHDDGGRAAAGIKGKVGDCVTRAIAIASGRPYPVVHLELTALLMRHSPKERTNASHGVRVQRVWFKRYMRSHGFVWTPTMAIGQGCTVHLREGELPAQGRLVVAVSRHYTAVIDGTIHDTHDPSRRGTRCVYGFWEFTQK